MADENVRVISELTDLDGISVQVGVDYDSVTITIGNNQARFELLQADEFAAAYNRASWEAGAYQGRMTHE